MAQLHLETVSVVYFSFGSERKYAIAPKPLCGDRTGSQQSTETLINFMDLNIIPIATGKEFSLCWK